MKPRKYAYIGGVAVANRHGEAIARVVQKVLDFTTKNPNADFGQVRGYTRSGPPRLPDSEWRTTPATRPGRLP